MFRRLGLGGPTTTQQSADAASAEFKKAQAAQESRRGKVDKRSMLTSPTQRERRSREGQRDVEALAQKNRVAQGSNVKDAVGTLKGALGNYGKSAIGQARAKVEGVRQRAKEGTSCMSDCKKKCKEQVGTLVGGKRRRTKRRRKSRKRKTKRNTKRRRKSRKQKTKRRRRRRR